MTTRETIRHLVTHRDWRGLATYGFLFARLLIARACFDVAKFVGFQLGEYRP
jgi:hypothetical protein